MARRKRISTAKQTDTSRNNRNLRLRQWCLIVFALVAVSTAVTVMCYRHSAPNETQPEEFTLANDDPDTQTASSPTAFIPLSSQTSWSQLDDPSADGWDTEAFHEKAKKQLDKIGQLLVHPRSIERQRLASLVTVDFSCAELIPTSVEPVSQDSVFLVERMTSEASSGGTPREALDQATGAFQGAMGLAEALKQAGAEFADAHDVRVAFKVFHVELHPNGVTTRQYLSLSGENNNGVIEHHATWTIHWQIATPKTKAPPKIQRIEVNDFEKIQTNNASGPLFADCTEAVLGQNDSYHQQFAHGLNHWLERIPFRAMLTRFGTPGIAVGDVNGDGLDDLYVCQEPGLPNRLFVQNPNGTVSDVSDQWGVDWLEDSRSAVIVDLDNDGDQDLAVAIYGNIVIAVNEGQRRFEIQTVLPCSPSTSSLTACDVDQDGRLDLYVCGYAPDHSLDESGVASMGAVTRRFVYHDDDNGAPNTLYRNETADSRWEFTDATQQLGLDKNNRRWSLAAAWEDYDNDGDPDLYVANDYGRNNLFRNDVAIGKQTFVNAAAVAGAEDSASGMSVTWGDYDRDGWMDIYVSNMFSAAGSRITHQAKFKSAASADVRGRLQRFARGNTMLRNLGENPGSPGVRFSDESIRAGVTMGRWAWGSNFVDLNNDGWEDLFVANGYMTTKDSGDL
jgi:hypothetical protein